MTEQYKEVMDYKKILIVAGIIGGIIAVVGSLYSLNEFGQLNFKIPDLSEQEKQIENSKVIDAVKTEYQKFIELGLSIDDIIDFQEMPCETFNTPEMISSDPKYTAIIEQRKTDCF